MKVSELSGPLLDYWVARAAGAAKVRMDDRGTDVIDASAIINQWVAYSPSTNWSQGGIIIDRAEFGIFEKLNGEWAAGIYKDASAATRETCLAYEMGTTILIAAMRAFVAWKYGDEVSPVPKEHLATPGVMR